MTTTTNITTMFFIPLMFFFAGVTCVATAQEKPVQPNFVIFMADDMGYGDLACYGHPINKTPNLDRLASEGMRFTDCHSGGVTCSPSRAAILTGRTPFRIGFYDIIRKGTGVQLRREEVTVATLLKQQGYDTCFVGKWHVSMLEDRKAPNPGDHGFDHWFATSHNSGPRNPKGFMRNGKKVEQVSKWYCDAIVDEAVDWLRQRPDQKKPFLLFVFSHEPHTALDPPKKYVDMYDNAAANRLEQTISYGDVQRKTAVRKDQKKYYYGTVTQLDNAFGELMRSLDAMGKRDNTLVFFTSDNGPESYVKGNSRERSWGTPGPFKGMKRYTYEGGHRVPGLARWPGHIKPGTVSDQLFCGTDILPTLCELAGAPLPKGRVLDGTSLVPVLNGEKLKRSKPLCWHYQPSREAPFMAMRDENYVMLAWPDRNMKDYKSWLKTVKLGELELYDVAKDPAQKKNLADQIPKRFKDMETRFRDLWDEIQAEGPVWKGRLSPYYSDVYCGRYRVKKEK